jgi:hypothetical protein
MREMRMPFEFTSSDGTGADEDIHVIPGFRDTNLRFVRIDAISYDAGVVAGVAITKGQFKAFPGGDREAMGGDTWHTFAALDTYRQNRVPFGNLMRPGEDLKLIVKLNTNGATARFRVERTLFYADPA